MVDAKGWLDCNIKFVKTPSNSRRDDYFQTYGEACYFHGIYSGGVPDKFLQKEFGGLEYIKKPLNFDDGYQKEVRYAFQIPKEYEIQVAAEGKMI